MPEVYQTFSLRDGFINSPDLLAFQLRPGPILQPIQEVEQHIFICEVVNLKRGSGELLRICVYASRLLEIHKLVLYLIENIVREDHLLELFMELLPCVDGTTPLPYF